MELEKTNADYALDEYRELLEKADAEHIERLRFSVKLRQRDREDAERVYRLRLGA